MYAQKQLIQHNPDAGLFGDCYRTCVAVILGIDASEVPHVCDKGWQNENDLDGIKAMREYLAGRGLGISKSVFNGDLSWSAFKNCMDTFNQNVPFIVTAMGSRGVNHCVVMVGGSVFCDPHTGEEASAPFTGPAETPEDAPLWWVEVITPLAQLTEGPAK